MAYVATRPPIDVNGIEVRAEWGDLDVLPEFPACPTAIDIDLAHDTIDTAVNAGVIDQESAKRRISVLNLRRIVLSNAQAEYGCRGQCVAEVPAEEAPVMPGQLPADLTCNLPVGRIETFAFGTPGEPAQTYVTIQTNGMGFKQ